MTIDSTALQLPAALLARADQRGNELAWDRATMPEVFRAASAAQLVVLGGQVQFRLADATCELYWEKFDPTERLPGEPWDSFVSRSELEAQRLLDRLPSDTDLIAEGIEHFDALEDQARAGIDLHSALCFVCYFASEDGWAELSKMTNRFPNER